MFNSTPHKLRICSLSLKILLFLSNQIVEQTAKAAEFNNLFLLLYFQS